MGHPPPPPRKKRTGLKVTLGIIGGLILLIIIGSALGSGSGNSSSGTQAAASSPSTQEAASPAVAPPAAPQIGDKVREGKFQFVATKISHAKSVGDTMGLDDTAQGEHLIISLKVTNIGNQSQTLDDSARISTTAMGANTARAAPMTSTCPVRTAAVVHGSRTSTLATASTERSPSTCRRATRL